MTLLAETRARCPELADFLEAVCETPLRFEGAHPNMHSADNHVHLWSLEWWADRHAWIDLDYRVAFVALILARWKGRLKGLRPYREAGYRFYLYEDLAPTVSVVAETPYGCAYGGSLVFVRSMREVMSRYVGRRWSENFAFGRWEISQERVLEVIEANAGSISRPSATALGLPVGKLRILIQQMGLERRINAIRKRYKRRPAQFGPEPELRFESRVYERLLPAGYK